MKRLADLLPQSIEQKELLRAARAQRAYRDWEKVVGEMLAKHTQPEKYENGILWVLISGSVWAQEINMRKDTIIEKLNKLSNETHLFKEIRTTVLKKKVRW